MSLLRGRISSLQHVLHVTVQRRQLLVYSVSCLVNTSLYSANLEKYADRPLTSTSTSKCDFGHNRSTSRVYSSNSALCSTPIQLMIDF
jgi:hypothetical protein